MPSPAEDVGRCKRKIGALWSHAMFKCLCWRKKLFPNNRFMCNDYPRMYLAKFSAEVMRITGLLGRLLGAGSVCGALKNQGIGVIETKREGTVRTKESQRMVVWLQKGGRGRSCRLLILP